MLSQEKNMNRFIAFEGPDCSGKSTQIAALKKYLEDNNQTVITTREPGGTCTGEAVRNILLDSANTALQPMSEVLLLLAQRYQNLHEVIKPALTQGSWVISDRFSLSTIVYQGYGRGLPIPEIKALSEQVLQGFSPDLTVVIDVPVEISFTRLGERGQADRFEALPQSFFSHIRNGYIAEAAANISKSIVINGEQDIQAVSSDLLSAINIFFGKDLS